MKRNDIINKLKEKDSFSRKDLKDEIKKCNTKVHLFVGQKEISSIKQSLFRIILCLYLPNTFI